MATRKLPESIIEMGASYDTEMNCIPLGTGMGGGNEGNYRVAIDTLASLIQLFNGSEHNVYHDISRCPADTVLNACRTGSGALHTHAGFTQGILRPTGLAGAWSRGQAWGMLGLSRAAVFWGEPYLTHARTACEYWKRSRPAIPPNWLSQLSGPPDPSSTIIASLAMLGLADMISDGNRWRRDVHRQISTIIRSPYFTGFQENGNDRRNENSAENDVASGIFWGCCYETRQGAVELVETAWGSFFLMAALCILVDIIEPNHC